MPTRPLFQRLSTLPPTVRHVVDGYMQGYFLMADEDTGTLAWYQAPNHTLMPLDDRLHIPKSLRRVLNQERFQMRISTDVAGVIAGCRNRPSTWISDELAAIYTELAAHGIVQTYEAWQGDTLAGGILGLALGGAYIGESMFTHIEDAGKVALVNLCRHLPTRGFQVFDAQLSNPHLTRFGSYEVPETEYLTLLQTALRVHCLL